MLSEWELDAAAAYEVSSTSPQFNSGFHVLQQRHTLRVTQTILTHHNENCAISVKIVRIVCLCMSVCLCVRVAPSALGGGADLYFGLKV